MVRTRADNTARKAVAAKAPRKILGGGGGGGASSSGLMSPSGKVNKYAGMNPVCPRPTPDWQKGISSFFTKSAKPATAGKENSEPEEKEMMELEDAGAASSAASSETLSQSSSQSSSSNSDVTGSPVRKPVIQDDSDED